ncbi:hypothetical protein PoB_007622000 [Plakobranchus ocellatus]|uniref:Uncharacterized protein n=1 Tax=Plakobranchus ocellatus TaxID=259542 RepID=A0AAV4E0E2_9GAST|nr:hypothetical protein PoB_007622000 [Plakobranchus ocellatus]
MRTEKTQLSVAFVFIVACDLRDFFFELIAFYIMVISEFPPPPPPPSFPVRTGYGSRCDLAIEESLCRSQRAFTILEMLTNFLCLVQEFVFPSRFLDKTKLTATNVIATPPS